MSVHYIITQDGVKKMRPVLERKDYLALRNSERQRLVLQAVRSGNEEQKHQLVQMNYSCLPNDDGSLRGSKRMTTTVAMDIDHIAAEAMGAVKDRILARKDELGLLMLEESARGAGYHLVFKRRPELSQEENLAWASELLGVEYDKGAKEREPHRGLSHLWRPHTRMAGMGPQAWADRRFLPCSAEGLHGVHAHALPRDSGHLDSHA